MVAGFASHACLLVWFVWSGKTEKVWDHRLMERFQLEGSSEVAWSQCKPRSGGLPCTVKLCLSPRVETPQHLWAPSCLHWELFFILHLIGISHVPACVCRMLSYSCAPLIRAWLHLLFWYGPECPETCNGVHQKNHCVDLLAAPLLMQPGVQEAIFAARTYC